MLAGNSARVELAITGDAQAARLLVRLREHLLIRRSAAGRAAVQGGRADDQLQAFSARAAACRTARYQRLAIQRVPCPGTLHVARPGAPLREVFTALAPSRRVSTQQRARRPRSLHWRR